MHALYQGVLQEIQIDLRRLTKEVVKLGFKEFKCEVDKTLYLKYVPLKVVKRTNTISY